MSGNVADLVAAAADRAPDHPAIVEPTGSTTTWGALEQRVDEVAGALRVAGVEPGDRVAVVLPNNAAFAAAYWGTLRAGGVVVPVNPAYTPPEREHIVTDAGARVVLGDGSAGDQWPVDVAVLDAASASGPAIAQSGGGDDIAVICYTSGTTGQPKGACLSHRNLLANLEAFSTLPAFSVGSDDVLLGVLPFFHVFGLNVVLNAAARSACTIVTLDRFSPRSAAAAMTEHGVTVAYGAPPVFAALAALSPGGDHLQLRAAVSGADALPVATFERFADRFGLEILEGYGLTETSPVLASNAAAPCVVPGSVGVALPGVELRVLDSAGRPAGADEVGEIHARGPNVFSGYHGRPEETAEVLREGWFATGDLGSLAADGYLTIAGRLKEMIIVNGFNVYPREVEQALTSHPDVVEAVVVGLPDDRTGERVRAVVVARPGAKVTADDVIDHCRGRLARYKLPREVIVAEGLPRLPSGKVARRLLRGGTESPARG